jgi:hypothetical protein
MPAIGPKGIVGLILVLILAALPAFTRRYGRRSRAGCSGRVARPAAFR